MDPASEDSPRDPAGMLIIAVGTDIVEVLRIGQMIERHGEIFLNRVYTDDEIRYCRRRREYTQHYAGRWAAKEAVMKTLGTGWSRGVGWHDIEICSSRSGRLPSCCAAGARSRRAGGYLRRVHQHLALPHIRDRHRDRRRPLICPLSVVWQPTTAN